MTPRAERVELRLTPLSPIHIGAGEDFDPTGYVIDDGVLYHFDPAAVPLDASDRKALLAAVNQRGDDAILAVQRFFHERADVCKGAARQAVNGSTKSLTAVLTPGSPSRTCPAVPASIIVVSTPPTVFTN